MASGTETDRLIDTKACEDVPPTEWRGLREAICSKRWLLSFIMFWGIFFLYALRVNLSVAVVCMVNSSSTTTSSSNASGPGRSNNIGTEGEFAWDKTTVASVLSAYFYGYCVLQIPGGWLAGRFGGSRVIFVSMLLSAIVTLILPVSVRRSTVSIYVLRVLLGLFAGVCYPAFQSMWGRWAPPKERTKLTSFAYCGGYVGSVVTFATSGVLCDYGFDGGWPSIFYIIGGLSLLWSILWHFLIYDSPSTHKSISRWERAYIVGSLGERSQKVPPTPWKGILTSPPFWSLIVAIVASGWVDYTFLTSLPQYMKDVLKFDIAQNGVLSAVPSVGQCLSGLLCGQVADYMRGRRMSTKLVRMIFQTIMFLGIAACLLGVGYIDQEHRYWGVVLLGLSGFFAGLQIAGYIANFIDIAPRFVGVLYGMGNCVATVPGFVTPVIVGVMTKEKSREEWQQVFYVCIGVSVFAVIVFNVFSSGHVQPWAVVDATDETIESRDQGNTQKDLGAKRDEEEWEESIPEVRDSWNGGIQGKDGLPS